MIFRKGDFGDSMYAVITGELDIISPIEFRNYQATSIDKWITTLKKGDIFGQDSFFKSKNRLATVVATKPGELLEITPAIIRKLQKFYPRTAANFYKNLSEILNQKLYAVTDRLINETMFDDITGLYNLRGFSKILEKEMHRSRPFFEQLQLSVFRIKPDTDIPYSDYEIKKHILICIGDVICRNARMQDTIALIDRETFLLLLTNIKADYAQEMCSQIKEIIETTMYGIDDYRIMVNVDYELHNLANGSDIIQNLVKIS